MLCPAACSPWISDAILDALLAQDSTSRVAVETLVTTGLVHVAGEVTTKAYAPIPALVREANLDIGCDSSATGFDGASCGVSVSIGAQSPDIAQGVDTAYEKRVEGDEGELDKQGAGDQGLMFGFACDDTAELMPFPLHLANQLSHRLSQVRKNGAVPYLGPDGKTQVTIEYAGYRPQRLDTVVVSTQHAADIDLDSLLTPDIHEHVVRPVLEELTECLDASVGDHAASQFEEGFVDVVADLPTDPQSAEAMDPGIRSLNDPADGAESGTMWHAASCDDRLDPTFPQQAAVLVEVVAAVCEQLSRAVTRSAGASLDVGYRVEQGQQLSDIVPVAAGESDSQRGAMGISDHVVF